jgi:hypothetical protein
MDRKLGVVRQIAKRKGIVGEITISKAKNKRFAIKLPNGPTINFGLYPFKGEGTFIDHGDIKLRTAWRARHSKIMKDGKPAYLNSLSPDFYSWNLLWSDPR